MKRDAWFGIEGRRGRLPVLSRVRQLTPSAAERKKHPHLFVLTWLYEPEDRSQLPSAKFYARLEQFEKDAVSKAEKRLGALFVGTETGSGESHYFFYVESVPEFAGFLDSCLGADEQVEFSSTDDPDWKEYGRLFKPVQKKR